MHVLDSPTLALIYTIHTRYTAAIVDGMLLAADARGLAVALTQCTSITFGCINYRLEP